MPRLAKRNALVVGGAIGIGRAVALALGARAQTSSLLTGGMRPNARPNCVCPGPTDTATWRASDPEWRQWKQHQLPIRRIARPQEIASSYVFLASEEASFMVGQSISPNGGDVSW